MSTWRPTGYTGPSPIPGHGPCLPHAVVVVHDDGTWKIEHTGHSQIGVRCWAGRVARFIEDWSLPMLVYIDWRDGSFQLYEMSNHERGYARSRRKPA